MISLAIMAVSYVGVFIEFVVDIVKAFYVKPPVQYSKPTKNMPRKHIMKRTMADVKVDNAFRMERNRISRNNVEVKKLW